MRLIIGAQLTCNDTYSYTFDCGVDARKRSVSFKLTTDNSYDINNRRLTNTTKATENIDAI